MAQQAWSRGETATAAGRWREALDLWRGRPLADVRGGPRLAAAVGAAAGAAAAGRGGVIDAQLRLGDHADLAGELRGLVAAEPLHEPLWARLG